MTKFHLYKGNGFKTTALNWFAACDAVRKFQEEEPFADWHIREEEMVDGKIVVTKFSIDNEGFFINVEQV